MRAGFFLDAADLIKGFADGCHHKKEEGVLFEAMVGAGLPRQGGPIPVMLAEHEQGRAFTRGMRDAANRLAAGNGAPAADVVNDARGYAALLRQHMQKENGILFPLADQVIRLHRLRSPRISTTSARGDPRRGTREIFGSPRRGTGSEVVIAIRARDRRRPTYARAPGLRPSSF